MLEISNSNELPTIPSKRYFTIGEVSELCRVKPHVLRYWEQEFPQSGAPQASWQSSLLSASGRHPHPSDPQSLLYEHGFTIGGARQRLSGEAVTGGRNQQPADHSPASVGTGRHPQYSANQLSSCRHSDRINRHSAVFFHLPTNAMPCVKLIALWSGRSAAW